MAAELTTSITMEITVAQWPITGSFTISRGAKAQAEVVVVRLMAKGASGRGECVPYARYGESITGVVAEIERLREALEAGLSRQDLMRLLPAGAARNAIDCAFWDLEAALAGKTVASLANIPPPTPTPTAFTISLGDPETMAAQAKSCGYSFLKLKLGGKGDAKRLAAIRSAVPDARLIADANEAWGVEDLEALMAAAADARLELIEQPLPADNDAALAKLPHLVPICADESAHDRASLAALAGRYEAVNIKLDKTGGLTEALAMAAEARGQGFRIMVGCMVATSLAMAPALMLASYADWVDLDGPLLLARDRVPSLLYRDGVILPPPAGLWGIPTSTAQP